MALEITIWVACGFWAYKIAQRNGRDPALAAFMGVLGGLVAVIIYYIIGKKKNCAICGKPYGKYGNNGMPVTDGRVCDYCNDTEVIPARLKQLKEAEKQNK